MEKEISRALRPFQKKLAAEAALRAVCVSGLFALPVWLALALARRCFGGAVGRPEALMLPVWALLAAALYALRYRPTQKRLAARLDEGHVFRKVNAKGWIAWRPRWNFPAIPACSAAFSGKIRRTG